MNHRNRPGRITRALLAVAGALLACSATAEPITLRIHHFLPPGSTAQQKFIKPWCDRIEHDSHDKLRCLIYPSMQLGGKPPELIEQVRTGAVDIVWTLPGYTPGRFPIMEVFELPFMSKSAEATSRAAWDYYLKFATDEFKDYKPLAFHVHDDGFIHTRAKMVRTLDDLRGLKIRAGTRLTARMVELLGGTPVPMPVTAITDALSKGVIDGATVPWEVVPAIKLQEYAHFHTETDPLVPALYTSMFVFAMNKAKYESLPPDLKAVIDQNSGRELSTQVGRAFDEASAPARKVALGQPGSEVYTVPYDEMVLWERASMRLYGEWVQDMIKRGQPGQDMVLDARALVELYSSPLFGGHGSSRKF
ncbi:MAG TPA: TRAP transporter substrate-binding protein [Burkholderiaceae bacterium]|nr:TRAP transporter substrate-binding protein [Burkholderiaceae bacterium]